MKTRNGTITKPELLAPAGDLISLRAALDAGCDAIYFGLQGFNMRAGADNFTVESLCRVVDACHKENVRSYLALNTLVYQQEVHRIENILDRARDAGVDAVICWDFAVLQAACERNLPVHVSTQMSIANASAILFFYRQFNIKRFVLARECSLDDIAGIKQQLARILDGEEHSIEIEVFAHGALCVSLSGRCLLSQFIYGKSANRGECLQPCRRRYRVLACDEEYDLEVGGNYVLSPRDLCTMPFIDRLLEAGVACLKLEGRNKSPEYVATVTATYRKAVDFYCSHRSSPGFEEAFSSLKKSLMKDLETVYNRGFSQGFFLGKPMNSWTDADGSKAPVRKEYIGVVTNYYARPGAAEIRVESGRLCRGETIMFQGATTGVVSLVVESMERDHCKIEEAEKGGMVAVKTREKVRPNDRVYVIRKTGGTDLLESR